MKPLLPEWALFSARYRPPHLTQCLVTIEFSYAGARGAHFTRREVWGAVYADPRGFLLTSGSDKPAPKGLRTAEEMEIPARIIAWCMKPEPYAEEDLLA